MIRLLHKIRSTIFHLSSADADFISYTFKKSLHLLILNIFSLVLGLLANYTLIKVAGTTNYGSYVYIFNLLFILTSFCIIGTDTLLVKKNPAYDNSRSTSHLKGVFYFSFFSTLLFSLIIGLISNLIFTRPGILSALSGNETRLLFFLILPLMSLSIVTQASLQGQKKIILSQLTEKTGKPILLILTLIILFSLYRSLSLGNLILINSSIIIFLFVIIFIFHTKVFASKTAGVKLVVEYREWTRSSFTFFLLNILYMANSRIDIFLLGNLGTNEQVGEYNIVLKLSEFVSFGLYIMNFVLSPLIAELTVKNEMARLQKHITRSARMVLIFSLPVFLCFVLFGKSVLGLFNIHSSVGQRALQILCMAQLINIIGGSTGTLLVMSGNQLYSIFSLGVGVVISCILNILLIPVYGIVGAAMATSAGLISWNILTYIFVRIKLKIHTTAF